MSNTNKIIGSLTLVALLLLTQAGWAQNQELLIKRPIDLREGPGSYHDLIIRLNEGVIVNKLNTQEGWLELALKEKLTGWIPDHKTYYQTDLDNVLADNNSRSIKESDRLEEFYQSFTSDTSNSDKRYVSPAQVAAAVRGFAEKYGTHRGESSSIDFDLILYDYINAEDYLNFRRKRLTDNQWAAAKRRFHIDTDTIPTITPSIKKMGWAISNVIAQRGLVKDAELQEYLNYVALLVAESSHRYEIPVHVHILNTNDVVGYGVPNGSVFVSKGALKLLNNEAEFAFFVGHELAHIVLQHGIQESRSRATKIKSDETFSELNENLNYNERQGDKYVQISQELTSWTDQVHDYIIKDKLNSYEFEADFWGMVYAYRAGYDPAEAIKMLQRLKKDVDDFETQLGEMKWQGTSVNERINQCSKTLHKLNTRSHLNNIFEKEFRAKSSKL